jgi:hypothetical protein
LPLQGDAGAREDAAPLDVGTRDAEMNDAAVPPETDVGARDAAATDAAADLDAPDFDATTADAAACACTPMQSCTAGACVDRCTSAAPTEALGRGALTAPALAHGGGVTLVAWTDTDSHRVVARLRAADGTTVDVPDVGGYASRLGQVPFSAPTALATASGFDLIWIENDVGGFTGYQFRHASVALDGTTGRLASFAGGLAIHYTDVSPRLFATPTGPLLVYRGRTTDPLPQARLVLQQLSDTFAPTTSTVLSADVAPEATCFDGAALATFELGTTTATLSRLANDGTDVAAPVTVTIPAGAFGAARLACHTTSYFALVGASAFHVAADGTASAALATVAGATLAATDHEGLVLGAGLAVMVWRIDEAGRALATIPLDTAGWTGATSDAALWTGSAWHLGFAASPSFATEARFTSICD